MERVHTSDSDRCVVKRDLTALIEQRRGLCIDGLLDRLRREVALVREELPELNLYHLHDVTLGSSGAGLIVQIEFRK